jgi:hypothetical protein
MVNMKKQFVLIVWKSLLIFDFQIIKCGKFMISINFDLLHHSKESVIIFYFSDGQVYLIGMYTGIKHNDYNYKK